MSTRIGEAIRDLGDVIGAIEAGRGDVVHVGPTGDGLVADNTVEISISVQLPFLPDDPGSAPGLSVTDAALDDDGSLRVNLIAARPVDDGSSTGAMAGDESGGQAGNDGPATGRPRTRQPTNRATNRCPPTETRCASVRSTTPTTHPRR